MILYFLLLKFKAGVRELRNPWNILWKAFWLAMAVFYAYMMDFFITLFPVGVLISLILLGIFKLTIFKAFFPSYHPLRRLFPQYYPVSSTVAYFGEILSDCMSSYCMYITVFLIVGSWSAQSTVLLWGGFTALVGGMLFRRCIQYLLDYRLSMMGKVVFAVTALIVGILFGLINFNLIGRQSFIAVLSPILLLAGWLMHRSILEASPQIISFSVKNIYVKMLFNNSKARWNLLMGLVYKGLVLFYLIYTSGMFSSDRTAREVFEESPMRGFYGPIMLSFTSSLILFTYAFNNTWGYWKSLWLNMELRVGEYQSMVKYIVYLLWLPLVIDFIISLVALSFTDIISFSEFLIGYMVSLVFLIMLATIISLRAKTVKVSLQIKGLSSQLGALVALLGTALLYAFKIDIWFALSIPVLLIVGGVLCWLSIKAYKKQKYRMFQKLFK